MIEYIEVSGIGRVRVSRRKGMRSMRISVTQNGEVRLALPSRVALRDGLQFLQSKQSWLTKHQTEEVLLDDGARIGKTHTLHIIPTSSSKSHTKLSANAVTVHIPEDHDADQVQKKISQAAKKALQAQAEQLLPQRLAAVARQHGFSYRSVSVKPLQSRWGSCSSRGDIVLNIYLMQLPWQLIDYVIAHELSHLSHQNHSDAFWRQVERLLPDYASRRRALKKYPTSVIDMREAERFLA